MQRGENFVFYDQNSHGSLGTDLWVQRKRGSPDFYPKKVVSWFENAPSRPNGGWHLLVRSRSKQTGLLRPFFRWWRGLDSNQRTLARADLQSAAFNHSATSPRCRQARHVAARR